jgi:hypothetical protein
MAGAKPPCGPPRPQSPRRRGPQGWLAAMSSASGPRASASHARRSGNGSPGQQSLGCELGAGQARLQEHGDAGPGRREADPAATRLPDDCPLAYFDHEWHRHDSQLLRANPDHDATKAAPHPFRNPAVAPAQAGMRRRPAGGSASPPRAGRLRSAHNGPQYGHCGKPEVMGQFNCYSVAAWPSCGVRMFRYACVSAIAPKVAPRLRDDARTGPTRRRRDEA